MKNDARPIRIGVTGCGYWGPNLIRNFASLPEVDLAYVCDKDQEKLNRILFQYPNLKGTSEFEDLLADDSVEAIVIATSAKTHYELAKTTLEHGKHVFVEKPLSLHISEGEELIEIARQKGLILMVGHLMLYSPVVERIKEYVDNGELGDILYLYSQRLNLGKVRHDENCLWSLGPHDISILLYLLEMEPVEIAAHGMSYLRKDVEDVVFCNLRFPNDVLAHLHISWLDPHKVRRLTIVGKDKMLVFDDMAVGEQIRIYDKGVDFKNEEFNFAETLNLRYGDLLIPAIVPEEPLKRECRHFIECITSGSEPRSDGINGLRVLRVLDGAQTSMNLKGAPVTL